MITTIECSVFTSKAGNELARGIAVDTNSGEQISFIGDKSLALGDIVAIRDGWATKYKALVKADADKAKKTVDDYKKLWD